MTDTSRKRCRKSKLVPRECAEFVEDDSVLQEPAQKKLLLEKIKKEPEDYVPPDRTSHEFSVKVEVEDVEESVPEEDSSSYMQYLFSLSKESQSTEPIASFEFADNNLLLENKLTFEEENGSYVDVRKVQKMLATLHKKYPLEREAVLHTRNQWGKIFNERYEFEFRRTSLDYKLQDVLRQWRIWTVNSRTRASPFSYKCYICFNAWWSLTEFKTHLTIHDECKLHTETREQECNIIAYEGNVPGFQEVYVHGKCLKCAKTYDHHLTNRTTSETFYYCNYCKEKFTTCSALAKHEGTCNKNPIRVLSISQNGKELKFSDFSCQVCNTVFLSKTDLTEHLVICHMVRSDDPIVAKLKNCKLCNRSYTTFHFHICLKKNMVHECKYCNAKFQNKQMMETHLDMWNKVVRCRLCDKYMIRGCMAGEHYALHSENFALVHRCLICKKKMKIFMDEETMRQHRIRYHNRIIAKRPQTDMLIMAKVMLQQCMLDTNVKKTIPKILRTQKVRDSPKAQEVPTSLTTPAPATQIAPTDPNSIGPKMTRGEPMQKVRVFVPKDKKKNKNANEPQMTETTICHDDEVSKATEELPPQNEEIKIKEEKDKDKTNEIEPMEDNTKVPENELLEISNTVIKDVKIEVHSIVDIVKQEKDNMSEEVNDVGIETKEQVNNFQEVNIVEMETQAQVNKFQEVNIVEMEKQAQVNNFQEVNNVEVETQEQGNTHLVVHNAEMETHEQVNMFQEVHNGEIKTQERDSKHMIESEGSKDFPKLMEELNEFLDIKPDIIKVKQEKLSDDESPQDPLQTSKVAKITESDLSKVFQSSSTFAEEVTENSEHSKVFKVSKSILQKTVVVKQEIKAEPEDDDLIFLDSSEIKEERASSDRSELSLLDLEPEVILKAGYRKRKVYRCSRCDYSGYHREYKQHINNHCNNPKKEKDKEKKEAEVIFKCTKCGGKYANIKRYALHFEKHGYRYMSCPECCVVFDNSSKLIPHLNSHVKNQFIRMLVINDNEDSNSKVFQCKTCKEVKNSKGFFEHWEKHLDLKREPIVQPVVAERVTIGAKGEQALTTETLKMVIELLNRQERTETTRTKTCCLCDRIFERRNDLKRHYIEHLLEDAFAKIKADGLLNCQMCGESHLKPDGYKKHMRDHASLPIYQCSLCNKTFSDSSNFTKHKKIHNLKAYVCDLCSKKFQAKISLEKHMEMHMTMAPIKCELCHRVFQDRSFYKRHYRQLHDKLFNKIRCRICRDKFSCLRDKWDHMWEVHKLRKDNADCPVCKRSYRKFADVKKHAAQEHGLHITMSNVWSILNQLGEKDGASGAVKEEARGESSDDDCLIIEEERETLVVYD